MREVIEDHRDQDDAVERDALLSEITSQTGGSRGSIAFAGEIERRGPAAVFDEVGANDFAHRLDVFLDPVELLLEFGRVCARVAGADRIEEEKITPVEPGEIVVDQVVRRLRHPAFFVEHDALRSEAAEVEPNRRRAGAAVVADRQWAIRIAFRCAEGVGDEEDVGFVLALLVAERHHAGGHEIVEGLAVDRRGVLGDDWRRRQLDLVRFLWFFFGHQADSRCSHAGLFRSRMFSTGEDTARPSGISPNSRSTDRVVAGVAGLVPGRQTPPGPWRAE